MKYMMFVCAEREPIETPAAVQEAPAAEPQNQQAEPEKEADDGSFPWLDEMVSRGVRLDGDRLKPWHMAKTVRVRGDEVLVVDGPFAETKDVIVGYDILECASLEEAVEVASKHPVAAFGSIEVRQFWDGVA
ncbi:MAG TPA: YciI family protein [Actinocrinis sp.]|jgi:hypothetical protein